MVYLISYDLEKPDKDYKNLYAELDRIKAVRVQKSAFILKSLATTAQVVGILTKVIDSNDKLLVIPIKDGAGGQMTQEFWDWFNAL